LYRIFFRNSDLARYPHVEENFRKIVKEDLTPLVSQVSVPTLILWGENDTVTPMSLAKELDQQIPDSKLITFPSMRHGLPMRNPELLVDPIATFLT